MQLPPTYLDHIRFNFPLHYQVAKELLTEPDLGYPETTPTPQNPIFDEYVSLFRHSLAMIQSSLYGEPIDPAADGWFDTVFTEHPDLVDEVKEGMRYSFVWPYNMLKYGRVFYVSDGLVGRLAKTDASVPSEDFALPFPCCLFVFTDQEILDMFAALPLESGEGGQLPDDLTGFVMNVRMEMTPYKGHQALIMEFDLFKDLHETPYSTTTNIDLGVGRLLSDVILDHAQTSAREFNSSPEPFILFLSAVLNSVLYIDSRDAEADDMPSAHDELDRRIALKKSTKKRKPLERQKEKVSSLPYILLGKSVPVLRTPRGHHRGPTNQFWVRGHWRVLKSERYVNKRGQRIRIEPFLKGTDVSDTPPPIKPYVVSSPKTKSSKKG